MPSKSKSQHNLMAMVANDPKAAKRLGIKQSVGEEFLKADKGKKFGSGGHTRADIQKVNKPKTDHGKMAFFKEGGSTMATKNNGITSAKMGSVRTAAPSRDGIAERGRTKGTQIKMAGNSIGTGPAMKKGGMAKKK